MERDLLEHILDVSRRMAETRDLALLLDYVMDEAIRLVGAERGYVVLVQPDGVLNFLAMRGQDGRALGDAQDQVSRSILRQVVDSGQPLVLRDAGLDPRFREAESVVILELRSVMCVPLISQGNTIGAIYVENRSIRGRFSEKDVRPLVPFANQAAVAIENARLFQARQDAFDALQASEEELRKHRDCLEELVAERTIELEQEIAERKQVEAALREAEERYRIVAELVSDFAFSFRVERDGSLVRGWATESYDRLTGYTPDERDKRGGVLSAVHPDDVLDAQERLRVLLSGRPITIQARIVTRSGEVRWIRSHARPIWDETHSRVISVIGAGRDITELKRTEDLLRAQRDLGLALGATQGLEKTLRLCIETAIRVSGMDCGGVYLVDGTSGDIDLALHKGLPAEFTASASHYDAGSTHARLVMAGNPVYARYQELGMPSSDPAHREGLRAIAIIPVPHEDRVIACLNVASHALDEVPDFARAALETIATQVGSAIVRSQAEEALRQSQENLQILFDSLEDFLFVLDMEGRIQRVNPVVVKRLGYSEAELLGESVLKVHHPDRREEAAAIVADMIAGKTDSCPVPVMAKDGAQILVETKITRGYWDGQEALFGISRDITERVRTEEALRQAKEAADEARAAAEAANRAKSAFLANMSHELRTPLNVIFGFRELMTRDPNLTPEQQENLATIGRSGEHLLALINDVLELSKIEAGRVELQLENFDLHWMLLGLREMFGLQAEAKGLSIAFDLAPGVPQYIRADQAKLRQVLINLLGNAVKFTHEGGVALQVKVDIPIHRTPLAGTAVAEKTKKQVDKGDLHAKRPISTLHFEIEDTGEGIAPGELDQVFDAFVQTSSGRQSAKGTGLGMPISREFVRMMGGDLTVSSQAGVGTVFRFHVPVEVVDAAGVEDALPPRRVIGLEPGQCAPDGGPYRLLVAEDEEASRRLLVEILRSVDPSTLPPSEVAGQGFEVREVVNGREAVEIWEEWRPHLIWMDIRMPVVDGREAMRYIKSSAKSSSEAPQGKETIIIAVTAGAFEEDRKMMLLEGFDDFVRKPVCETDIFDALARHLGLRFMYEEVGGDREKLEELEISDLKSRISNLPPALLADMEYTALISNVSEVFSLIDQVRAQDPVVADVLARLANGFEFTKILALAREAAEGRDE